MSVHQSTDQAHGTQIGGAAPKATTNYLVLGCRSWNRQVFDQQLASLPGSWHYTDDRQQLNREWLRALRPRYLFFLHWSWKVPAWITDDFECVCFHATDLPYGRGGSPIQNLIVRGHQSTQLTALRMVEQLDAGPIYAKRPLELDGTVEDILTRASWLAAELVEHIVQSEPTPEAQQGPVTEFDRRRPQQSEIPAQLSPQQLYDHIRMLDGEGYPPAFIESDGLKYEFRSAALRDGQVEAMVTIHPASTPDSP